MADPEFEPLLHDCEVRLCVRTGPGHVRLSAQVPAIIEARTTPPAERMLLVHYFTTYCDWFVAGFDPRTATGSEVGRSSGARLGRCMC